MDALHLQGPEHSAVQVAYAHPRPCRNAPCHERGLVVGIRTLSVAIDTIRRCFPTPREPMKPAARMTGSCCISMDPQGSVNAP